MSSTESKSLSLPMLGAGDNDAAIDRRGFLTESIRLAVLAALAGTAASCSAGGSPTGPSLSGSFTVKLSDYASLASSGGVATFNHNGLPIAIANLGGGNWGAYSLICPHQGGLVQWVGNRFQCTVHGSEYNLQGDWEGGQPTGNLHHYKTSYDASTDSLTISS